MNPLENLEMNLPCTLSIVPSDDPVLYRKADFVNFSNPGFDIEETATQMFRLMRRADGIGLAAPQVGISKRLFVLGIDDRQILCINPKITKTGRTVVSGEEGCLSYPGVVVEVPRCTEIQVEYLDITRRWRKATLTGLWARAFSHELDHLQGVVMHERAAR